MPLATSACTTHSTKCLLTFGPRSNNFKRPTSKAPDRGPITLELQLKTTLKEVRAADQVETIKRTVTVREREADLIRQVPVHHRSEAPERAAFERAPIEIDVREASHQLPRAQTAFEHRSQRRDLIEEPAFGVIDAGLTRGQPRHHRLAAVRERIAGERRVSLLP